MRQVKRTAALKVAWDTVRGQRRPGTPGVGERLAAFPRMVRASRRGEYLAFDTRRLALLALAAAYIVSPIDLLPEAALFVVGLTDDALVLAWLAGALLADTESFLEWERARERVVPGHVMS